MQLIALIWGILAILGLFVAFIPCLGSLNWLNIPFAVVGLVISMVAAGNAQPGSKGSAYAGIALNGVAIVFGGFRLMIGGGIL